MKSRLFFLQTVFWLALIVGQAYADSLSPNEIIALAQRGDAVAEYELGRMYQGGRGVTQDNRRAVEWYRRSAEQGYAPAERSLGGMYRGGYGGLPEDDAEAREWYGKAAAQGDTLAKFALVIDDWRITAFIRSLPQGDRSAIFFLLIAMSIIVPVGVFILFVVFCLRFIKAMRKGIP
jgi:TPR repeat protein